MVASDGCDLLMRGPFAVPRGTWRRGVRRAMSNACNALLVTPSCSVKKEGASAWPRWTNAVGSCACPHRSTWSRKKGRAGGRAEQV